MATQTALRDLEIRVVERRLRDLWHGRVTRKLNPISSESVQARRAGGIKHWELKDAITAAGSHVFTAYKVWQSREEAVS